MSETGAFHSIHTLPQRQTSALRLNILDSSRQLTASDDPQVAYLLLQLRPPAAANIAEGSRPLNLAIVIDRSTSMEGERLETIKRAANLVVDKLSNQDHLAIIAYNDRADVVVPAGPVRKPAEIKAKIGAIRAAGGTETLQGLKAGVHELSKFRTGNAISHLILLTDGYTYGDSDACLDLAQKAATRGYGISAFGIGAEWDDIFLDRLVAPSGGQAGFIENPEQIIHLLRKRIQHLGVVYAQNVRLSFNLPAGVMLKDAFKITPFAQPIDVDQRVLQLGTIEGYAPLMVLIELGLTGLATTKVLTLPLSVEANIPGLDSPMVSLRQAHELPVGSQSKHGRLPPKLLEAVRTLNLHRMNEQIWNDVENGEVSAATRRLEFLSQRLTEAGLTQLAQTALAQTQHLRSGQPLSAERRMALKYGTRAEMTNSLTLLFERNGTPVLESALIEEDD